MEELVWSLVSLAVAGVALATIAVPTVIGTGRVLRAVRRRSCNHGFGRQAHPRQRMTPEETAIALRPAAAPAATVAVAVPVQHTADARSGLRATAAPSGPLSNRPNGACRHELTAPAKPMLESVLGIVAALTPLERAVWQAHERRGVPRAVQAAWDEWCEQDEGPHELVPGRYPLLGGLLSRQQIAEMLAAQGIASWEHTAVTGASPMDPTSDGWN